MIDYQTAKETVWGVISCIGYEKSKERIVASPDLFSEEVVDLAESMSAESDPFSFLESACVDVFEELVPCCWD